MPERGQLQVKVAIGLTADKNPANISLYSLISHLQKLNANYYEAQNDSPKTRVTCGLVVGFRVLSLLFQHEVSLLVRIFPLSTQKKSRMCHHILGDEEFRATCNIEYL